MTATEFFEIVKGFWLIFGPTIGLAVGAVWQRKIAISDREDAAKQAQRSFYRENLKENISEVRAKMASLAGNASRMVSQAIRQEVDNSMDAIENGTRLKWELELLTIDDVADAATALNNTAHRVCTLATEHSPIQPEPPELKEARATFEVAQAGFMRVCNAYLTVLRKELHRSE